MLQRPAMLTPPVRQVQSVLGGSARGSGMIRVPVPLTWPPSIYLISTSFGGSQELLKGLYSDTLLMPRNHANGWAYLCEADQKGGDRMGMYDHLRVETALPDPELQERIFQTKSLACALLDYTITHDG